jgi:gas vesicle protein
MDWQVLSSSSHYKTAVAIKNELQNGNMKEAYTGIEELIEALSRSDKRALKSQLVRLMTHIIKWKSQPERHSLSWVASIKDAREEITDIQEETPSLTNQVIQDMWNRCLQIAIRDAQGEMNKKTDIEVLSWKEVFEDSYDIEDGVLPG